MTYTPLTISEAARRLGVCTKTVRTTLDARLQPTRDSRGNRLYDPNTVEIVALERAQRAAHKAAGDS